MDRLLHPPPTRRRDASAPPSPRKYGDARLTCLLTPLPRGKELSLALVRYLSEEIPDVRFTLDAREHADAVWICGYGERAAGFLTKLRALQPGALIVVTGRAPTHTWASAVLSAGADFACSWPVDYHLLSRILHQRHAGTESSTDTDRLDGLYGADEILSGRAIWP